MDCTINVVGIRIRAYIKKYNWSLIVWYRADRDFLEAIVPEIVRDKITSDDVFDCLEAVAGSMNREIKEYHDNGSGTYQVIYKPLPGIGRPGNGGFQRCIGGFKEIQLMIRGE